CLFLLSIAYGVLCNHDSRGWFLATTVHLPRAVLFSPQGDLMASSAIDSLVQPLKKSPTSVSEVPRLVSLELLVTDSDSIAELLLHEEGAERDAYALCALRIGLLSLRHARGQIDADAVKREGDRMLWDLRQTLELNRTQ